MSIFLAPTQNYVSTTLNGSINDSIQTITVNDASKLQAPGYIVIDREDGNGTATPNSREVVYYTGISGSDLTGCVRPSDSSTARSHSDGALVEAVLTVGMWNSLATAVSASLNEGGTGLHVSDATVSAITQSARFIGTSVSSISWGSFKQIALSSVASIAQLHIGTRVDASGASVTGVVFPANSNLNITAKAYAYQNASPQENLTSNTPTKVTLDAEGYDLGGNFATSTFTAPVAGQYLIVGQVTYISVVADKPYKASIYLSGGEYARATQHASHADTIAVGVSGIYNLVASDTVELYATQVSGANTVDIQNGPQYTYLMVSLLA